MRRGVLDRTALPRVQAPTMILRLVGKINCRGARDVRIARGAGWSIAVQRRLGSRRASFILLQPPLRAANGVDMSVLLEKRSNGVAIVTLDRPQVLNALDVPAKE